MTTKLIDRLVPSKHSAIFMNWGRPRGPVTQVEFEARKCIVCSGSPIPMRSHALSPDMTIGGIDDEPM
ncbi:hypothetical protein NUH16_011183 [Penicillium rubens]|nr:hypothetical protein NUH16_011183 [Penicillium rubens]